MRKGSEHHIAVANLFFLFFLDNSIITGGERGIQTLVWKRKLIIIIIFFLE